MPNADWERIQEVVGLIRRIETAIDEMGLSIEVISEHVAHASERISEALFVSMLTKVEFDRQPSRDEFVSKAKHIAALAKLAAIAYLETAANGPTTETAPPDEVNPASDLIV